MEQQSRSNATNASDATNNQAADKTSSITPEHIFGLLALNPGPPSPCSSFSTPSVADSVEFTETKPEALAGLGLGIDAIEQKAPGNAVMNDTESESDKEETPAGGVLSVPLNQVCLFLFFENTTFRFLKSENGTFHSVGFAHRMKRRVFATFFIFYFFYFF
jgi:hypothetical protein